MRGRALLGGGALVAAVALWHRPSVEERAGHNERGSTCSGTRTGYFCDAITGLSKALRDPLLPMNHGGVLPPRETPGAVDPRITQANIDTTICQPGYAGAARPPYSVTGPLKHRLMQAQHPGEPLDEYELDHLIPISLGGAPLDQRDLWLQPRRGPANADAKNILAYVLWRLVCDHQVSLATAQRAISSDWTKAYQLYATPENVTRYHFRHPENGRDEQGSTPG